LVAADIFVGAAAELEIKLTLTALQCIPITGIIRFTAWKCL